LLIEHLGSLSVEYADADEYAL